MMREEKIKVAIVINDLLIGGAPKLVLDTLRKADFDKFDYTLITLFSFPNRPAYYDQIPKEVAVKKLSFKRFFDLKSWRRLSRELKELKPDVLVSHLFFSNTITRIFKPFLGYKVISFEHNTYLWKPRLHIFLDWLLSFFSYKIVAVSETVKDFASQQAHIRKQKFQVIENGIDFKKIQRYIQGLDKTRLRSKLKLSAKDEIAINVARFSPQKNQEALIEAFADFSHYKPNLKLIILGGGGLEKKLKQRVKDLGAEDRIFLPGFKSGSELYQYYFLSDYFVSSSIFEGFGIAHAEALACGLPLLSTKTAGPDKMIQEGENGFFISSSSQEAIKRGLEKMAQSDLRALSLKSQISAQRYDIKKSVERLEKLISDAAK